MITKQKYVEYLVSTPINDTCTNLAEHPDGMSHDTDRNHQMPVPQSAFAAQSPRLLLSCLAFFEGSRDLAQQNHLARSYRPVQRLSAKPTSLPYYPGFPADLAKVLEEKDGVPGWRFLNRLACALRFVTKQLEIWRQHEDR